VLTYNAGGWTLPSLEAIKDCSEDCGVTVVLLIKVCGFKTLFHKRPDPSKVWTIPKEKCLVFSSGPAHLQVKKVQMLLLDAESIILHPHLCSFFKW